MKQQRQLEFWQFTFDVISFPARPATLCLVFKLQANVIDSLVCAVESGNTGGGGQLSKPIDTIDTIVSSQLYVVPLPRSTSSLCA